MGCGSFPCPASRVNAGPAGGCSKTSRPGVKNSVHGAGVEPCRNGSPLEGAAAESQLSHRVPRRLLTARPCQSSCFARGSPGGNSFPRAAQLPQPGGLSAPVSHPYQPPFPQAWGPGVTTAQAHNSNPGSRNALAFARRCHSLYKRNHVENSS